MVGLHYIAALTSHPFISVMSVFPGQTSEDLAKKSGPICSCDITIYVSTGHNPHYTDLTWDTQGFEKISVRLRDRRKKEKSLPPLFVIPLSIGERVGPSPHHDNLSACSSQIYILLNKRHILLLFISPQILYLCYCHVRACSSPRLPSGASHHVCHRNHLICRLWSAGAL